MNKRLTARSLLALMAILFLLAACDEKVIGSAIADRLMTEQAGTATAKVATSTPTEYPTPPTPTCAPLNKEFKGPTVCSFTAKFVQDNSSTFYTVVAGDPAGGVLTYTWSNSNPCGKFVASNLPEIYWEHPDSELPGDCPVENVHPGTITVVITSAGGSVKCEYLNGSATGDIVQCVDQ